MAYKRETVVHRMQALLEQFLDSPVPKVGYLKMTQTCLIKYYPATKYQDKDKKQ
jgi:hypothetical protein